MKKLEEVELGDDDEEMFPGQRKEESTSTSKSTSSSSASTSAKATTATGSSNAKQAASKPSQGSSTSSQQSSSSSRGDEESFPGQQEEEARIAAMLASDPGTLSEPLWRTIWRDVFSVLWKMMHILFPFSVFFSRRQQELRNWDLWGPLVFSFILAVVVSHSTNTDRALVFIVTISVLWIGGFVVSLNAILLGGHIVMGYCLAPLDAAAIACMLWDNNAFRIAVVAGGFVWSLFASWGFVAAMMPPDKSNRGFLVSYPVCLFYLFVAWVIAVSYDLLDLIN